MPKIKKPVKRIILALFLGFLTTVLLAFFGDFKKTKEVIITFDYWFVAPIAFLSLVNFGVRIFRYRYYLSVLKIAQKLSFKEVVLIFFAGVSMTVTPGKVGEVIKSYFIKDKTGVPMSETIPVIFAERFTDALAALVLMSGGFLIYSFGLQIFLFVLLGSLIMIVVLQQKNWCYGIIKWLEKVRILKKVSLFFKRFYDSVYLLIGWKHIFVGLLFGVLAWGAQATGLYLVLIGLHVAGNPLILFFTSLLVFCSSAIIAFATFIPGGLGISEGTTTGFLILFLHIGRSTAVAATLLIRALTLWFGVSLGIIALYILLKEDKLVE